jgi:hypothetical protein
MSEQKLLIMLKRSFVLFAISGVTSGTAIFFLLGS